MLELIWDGKYDTTERRVALPRVALPFQTVETINESARERQRSLFLAEPETTGWRNRLIWGDKKYVLSALLNDFAGAVSLIYIDPPFATGADFSFTATLPDAPDNEDGQYSTFTKEPSIVEQKAYRDTWGRGLQSYLQWLWETVAILRELLTADGTLYLHLDWRMVHYARVVLDEVFGAEQFQNEIIWQRSLPHGNSDYKFGASHDTILRYTRSDNFKWHPQYAPHREEYLRNFYKYNEPDGRRYRLISCINPNPNRPNLTYSWKGITKVWKFSQDRMAKMDREGLLVYSKNGIPQYKGYLDRMKGVPLQDVWTDIPPLMGSSWEWVAYPTQKPAALLERIISSGTDEGDLVLDCFVGSGTSAVVAEKLRRRWIAADLGRFAIHTTRKRLLDIPEVKPFAVQNLGKYERQLWQMAEFGETATARTAAYRKFILDLYHAQPVAGYTWLHGLKGGRMVHVGTVDAPVTSGDVKQIVAEFHKAVGTGKDAPSTRRVDLLGWDFAFELNEVARQDAERTRIDLRLVRIPREVLETRAVEQGDIHFFELAALSVGTKQTRRKVALTLEDFVIPLDDVPADVQKAVTHWSQWIDYWAVDWDNKGDAFHNEWQAFRTRKSNKLTLKAEHEYDDAGDYSVVVKVIDILGNDTTKALQLKVASRA